MRYKIEIEFFVWIFDTILKWIIYCYKVASWCAYEINNSMNHWLFDCIIHFQFEIHPYELHSNYLWSIQHFLRTKYTTSNLCVHFWSLFDELNQTNQNFHSIFETWIDIEFYKLLNNPKLTADRFGPFHSV